MLKQSSLGQKKRRFKSAKHLAWVRSLSCSALSLTCNGPIQAHHLLRPWVGGRGMGMKADDRNAIPLCAYHHSVLHTQHGSESKFFHDHGRLPEYAMQLAEEIFNESVKENSLKIN